MNWTVAALLLLAAVLANLPFASERIFLVWRPRSNVKSMGWRLCELVVYYFLTGAVAWALESRVGPVHTQRWEFYATTACLFLVFAYPGYVVRYLWRRRGP